MFVTVRWKSLLPAISINKLQVSNLCKTVKLKGSRFKFQPRKHQYCTNISHTHTFTHTGTKDVFRLLCKMKPLKMAMTPLTELLALLSRRKEFAIVHESVTVWSPRLIILDKNHLSFSGEKLWIWFPSSYFTCYCYHL